MFDKRRRSKSSRDDKYLKGAKQPRKTQRDMDPSYGIAESIVKDSLTQKYKSNPSELYYDGNDRAVTYVLDKQGYIPALGNRLILNQNPDLDTWWLNKHSLPGVMALRFSPSYGYSEGVTSPLNQAGKLIYQKIRSKITGVRTYYAADLMLYFIGLDSVVMYYYYLKRLYGILNMNRDGVNNFVPSALIRANLVDEVDAYRHKCELYSLITTMEKTLISWDIPGFIYLYDRRKVMLSSPFQDVPSRWAQMYMFVPEGYYEYYWGSESDNYSGKALYHKLTDILPSGRNLLTVDDLWNIWLERMCAPLSSDGWIDTMRNDLRTTYGYNNSYTVEHCDVDYTVDFNVYSKDLLNQVHNATLLGEYSLRGADVNQVVTVDPSSGINLAKASSYLTFRPNFDISPYIWKVTEIANPSEVPYATVGLGLTPYFLNRIIDSDNDTFSTPELVEATRLANIAESVDIATRTMLVATIASEVVHVAYMYYYDFVSTASMSGRPVLVQSEALRTSLTSPYALESVDYDPEDNKYRLTTSGVVDIVKREFSSFTTRLSYISQFSQHPAFHINGWVAPTYGFPYSTSGERILATDGVKTVDEITDEFGIGTASVFNQINVPRIVDKDNLTSINYYVMMHMLAVINNPIVNGLQ